MIRHELPEVVQLAYDCGAKSVTSHKLSPGDCGPIDEDYYRRLMHYIGLARARARQLGIAYGGQDDYQVAGAQPAAAAVRAANANGVNDSPHQCEFQSRKWLLLTLDPWGNLSVPCRHVQGKFGSIAATSLDRLLVSDPFTALLDKFARPEAAICSQCIYHRPT